MTFTATTLRLALAYAAFIVYGSLVPLDFHPLPLAQAWDAFRNVPYLELGLASRADWVANGVLYAPLGALLSLGLAGERRAAARLLPALLMACALCTVLAFAVEFTQLFFPPRTVSQNDLIAECIGSVVGAVAAPFCAGWLRRLAAARFGGGARFGRLLLQAYGVGYVLFCFFPFDLLLSVAELREKAASRSWGWLIATPDEFSALRSALHLLAEVVLTMPFGALLARTAPLPGRPLPTLWRAAWAGALLGVAIEGGQFLIDTAITQGASVATRALGTVLGLIAARQLQRTGIEPWRRAVIRHSVPAGLLYLLLLSTASGWWSHPWSGLDGARVSWQELRWMPFYYGYYTSEALALYSAASVVLMYAPLTVLCWARGLGRGVLFVVTAGLATVMQIGKLFLAGTHPDPTDVLIAVAANAMLLPLLMRIGARPRVAAADAGGAAAPVADAAPALPATTSPAGASSPARALLLLAVPPALLGALALPAFGPAVAVIVGVAAIAAAGWPPLALAVVAAALPVFDLAPWTGRFFVDEFDFLQAACLAAALWRTPPAAPRAEPASPWARTAFAVFGLSLAIAAARALWPLPAVDANAFASYYSGFNALRIAKGALWAWLFITLYGRLAARGVAGPRAFSLGLQLGLLAAVLFIGWERSVFAGSAEVASSFRVSGPFSAMHKGGAYVECFLATAAAYAMAITVTARSLAARAAALALLAGSGWAVAVTYSRNGWAAFALVCLIGIGWAVAHGKGDGQRSGRRALAAAAALLLVLGGGAAALLGSGFARERLGQSGQEFATRAAHWADALRMRDEGVVTQLFGMGLGRFPETHFWRSREAVHAASFRIERDGGHPFLRLGAGAPVYVEQIVDPTLAGTALTLHARLRSAAGQPTLALTLCRKWGLTSLRCVPLQLAASAPAGQWGEASASLPADALPAAPWYAAPPLKLSLLTPGGTQTIDVDDLQLAPAAGGNVLANGDFSAGLDRWFFATDTDPPWHIHSLPVALLFDQGWLGLLAGAAVVAAALAGGVRALRGGQPAALAPLAAFSAFLVSGALNTLIDAPRFLWLFLVLAWLCASAQPVVQRPPSNTRNSPGANAVQTSSLVSG